MTQYKLNATTQKSYYGKAIVKEYDDKIVLQSYSTDVCYIPISQETGEFLVNEFTATWGGYSRTTMNHINDFRKLFYLEPMNKREWLNANNGNGNMYSVVLSNGYTTRTMGVKFDNYIDALTCAERMTSGHIYGFVNANLHNR